MEFKNRKDLLNEISVKSPTKKDNRDFMVLMSCLFIAATLPFIPNHA